MHPSGPPLPPQPGWYPDPYHPDYLRWFDGYRWTAEKKRAKATIAIIGPILIVASLIATAFFCLTHPTVDVPLAGSQDCGTTSFELGTGLSDYEKSDGDSDIVVALRNNCRSDAKQKLIYAMIILVVGVVGGGLVTAAERRR